MSANRSEFKKLKKPKVGVVADMTPAECMRIGKYLDWLSGEASLTPELQALINELDAEYLQNGGKTIKKINAELEAELLT